MAKKRNINTKKSVFNLFKWFGNLSSNKQGLVVVLLVVIGFIGYNLTLDYLDKRKFTRIEETVLELTERISKEFEAKAANTSAYCMRAQRKSGEGPLSCRYQSSINYSGSPGDFAGYIISSGPPVDDEIWHEEPEGAFTLDYNGISCSIRNSGDNSSVELGCSDFARSEYYPLVN